MIEGNASMRIAQLAPLWETIPPTHYGGTELVVHLLTEELVHQGHEVVLFAAGGSTTSAMLEVCAEPSLREIKRQTEGLKTNVYPGSTFSIYYELQLLDKVFSQANQFDVIHNH